MRRIRRTTDVGLKLATLCVTWLGMTVRPEVGLVPSACEHLSTALTTINHNKENSYVESVVCRQALRHVREELSVSRPESDY